MHRDRGNPTCPRISDCSTVLNIFANEALSLGPLPIKDCNPEEIQLELSQYDMVMENNFNILTNIDTVFGPERPQMLGVTIKLA
jgi:hypothetical protein